MRKAFELLDAQKEEFSELITRENGKPLADSRAEVGYAAEFFRWYSEEAVRNIGQVSRAPSSGARILVQHKPAGVAVLITPWNFPVAMGTRKIAPALAAGCTVIVKPASETPLTMLLLAQLLQDAGVPAGVVNVLPSRRSSVIVGSMLKDPRVRVVSFTGSTETGRALLGEAAKFVVNPRMELGGNAPFLIFEDADLEAAVAGAMTAKMRNMGEACTAANRIYVHESIHDAFVARFAAAMGALKVGNGLTAGVAVGPMVNRGALEKVESLVEEARGRGARVVTGGHRLPGPGYFTHRQCSTKCRTVPLAWGKRFSDRSHQCSAFTPKPKPSVAPISQSMAWWPMFIRAICHGGCGSVNKSMRGWWDSIVAWCRTLPRRSVASNSRDWAERVHTRV